MTSTTTYHTCLRCGSIETQERCTNCGKDTRTPFGSKPRSLECTGCTTREEWRGDAIAVIPAHVPSCPSFWDKD